MNKIDTIFRAKPRHIINGIDVDAHRHIPIFLTSLNISLSNKKYTNTPSRLIRGKKCAYFFFVRKIDLKHIVTFAKCAVVMTHAFIVIVFVKCPVVTNILSIK